MPVKAFIFDLDGVIVDTAKYHFLAWKKLSARLNIHFSEKKNEQLKGVSRVKSLETILNWGGKSVSEEVFQELMEIKNKDYLSYIYQMNESEILPGVLSVLTFLKSQQQRIALGSASKNARKILTQLQLKSQFDAIVDGTNVTKAKPNSQVFLMAAEQLGIHPKQTVVFEDAIAGVKAANRAGMISIGIGKREVLNEADFVFKDFTAMSNKFLLKLITGSKSKK